MDLVIIVLTLALVGLIVWLITTKIPMDPMFKWVIQIFVIVVMILWLIRALGVTLPNVIR